MEILAFAALSIALVVSVGLLLRRGGQDPASLHALETVSRTLGQLQSEFQRVGRAQEELRRDVQLGREASLQQLTDAAQGIRGEIGAAQKALAEVKAIEQGRARQMEQAADTLKRLEAVVAGSATRGAAGENILARALGQLPPDLLAVNVAFGNKVVEYALRLPGGRVLPIDSKWTSVAPLEKLSTTEDPAERRKLQEQVTRDVRGRIREMTKYLDPERTLSIALLAVPDAVYASAPEAHGEGYREGILVVPYSLAMPYVLALYRLTLRFGSSVDTDQLAARLRSVDESLRRLGDEVEGRLSRGLVQMQNAREAMRDHVLEAQQATARLLRAAEVPGDTPAEALPLFAVGERD
ncbi:MAG: DNA recombination protein RmuC [Vicinamibacteria bacterium]